MSNNIRQGVFAVLVTPLTEEGEIDEGGLRHLVDFCCERGFSGIVVLGSNGEFPYLSYAEKRLVMRAAAGQARGRLTVVAGVSAAGTDQSLAMVLEAKEAGCDAALAALPAHFALSMDDVLSHFRVLAEAGGIPILFYYFPDTTGLVLAPEQFAMVADIEGVVGAKVTVLSVPFLRRLIELTRDRDFALFTGTTFLLKQCLESGGAGVFCPLPSVHGEEPMGIWDAYRAGDASRAEMLQDKVIGSLPILSGMDIEPAEAVSFFKALTERLPSRSPIRFRQSHSLIKEALRLQGHPITNMVKRPFRPVTKEQSELVARTMSRLGWL